MPPNSSRPFKSVNVGNTKSSANSSDKGSSLETATRNRKLTRHKTVTTPSRFARLSSGLTSSKRKFGVLNNSAESIFQSNKQAQTLANKEMDNDKSNPSAQQPSDLNEITPFGGLRTGNILHRNSWKSNRSGGSSNRWSFLHWSHRKGSPTTSPTTPQDPAQTDGGQTITPKQSGIAGYSLLSSKKNKNRHISCPDISSASSESSRSASPTSFKSSLTSLFQRPQSSQSAITPTSAPDNNIKIPPSTMSRPLTISGISNVLQRTTSNNSKKSLNRLTISSTSQRPLRKSPSPIHYGPRKEHLVAHEVPGNRCSFSDESEVYEATVSYCDNQNTYENFPSGYFNIAQLHTISSLPANEAEQIDCLSREQSEFLSESLTPLHTDDRYIEVGANVT